MAIQMGIDDLKASNGWFDCFKRRYNIVCLAVCGGSPKSWRSGVDKLASRKEKYLGKISPKNVYNIDETGVFYNMMLDRTLALRGKKCHRKRSKERLMATLCTNMDGSDKMKLVIIGKFQKPRCFNGLTHSTYERLMSLTKKLGWRGTFSANLF